MHLIFFWLSSKLELFPLTLKGLHHCKDIGKEMRITPSWYLNKE